MRTFTTFSRRLLVLAALGLAASACSSAAEDATEVAADGVAATEVTAGSVVDGSSTTETSEVEAETEAQAADATTSTTQAQQEPETTTTTSVGSGGEPDGLSERLAAYLLANPEGLEIDEASAACSGDALASTLPADRMELLVTNLEDFDELEDGRQFSAEERLSIAEAFAVCLDFGLLVDEILQDEPGLTAAVACIEAEGGIDRVEAVILAGALGEDTSEPVDSLLVEALALCPQVARAALAEMISERMFAYDAAVVASCLDAFSDDEVVGYLSGPSGILTVTDQLEFACFGRG